MPLTVRDLSENAEKVVVPDCGYDHLKQQRFSDFGSPLAFTQNGTRTFDGNGKPADADHD